MTSFLQQLSAGRSLAWIIFFVVFLAFIAFFSVISFYFGRFVQKKNADFVSIKKIKEERKNAVSRSRAVIGGQVTEQIAPLLPDFPCQPGDVRFVGKPIDFVGFPGAAEGKPIEEVLLIEVKTGKSQLTQREKEIKNAVDNGKVRYVIYRTQI